MESYYLFTRVLYFMGEHYNKEASLPEANRKDDVSSEANSDGEKSEKSQSGEPNNSSEDRDSSKGTPGTPTPKTIYHGPSRKGRTYNKHTVGTPIIHKCDLSHLPEYFQH